MEIGHCRQSGPAYELVLVPLEALLDYAPLGAFDKRQQVGHAGVQLAFAVQMLQGLGGIQLGRQQNPVSMLQGPQLLVTEPRAFQADAVEAIRMRVPFGRSQRKGQDVLSDRRAPTHVSILTDAAILVDGAEGTHTGMVFHGNVTGQSGPIREDAVVSDPAVVTDVGVGHDEAVASYPGSAPASIGSPRDGHAFAEGVVIAGLKASGFATVLQILRGNSQTGKGVDAITRPKMSFAVENHVRDQVTVFPQDDIGANGAIRTYGTGFWNGRRRSHYGCWVNAHSWLTVSSAGSATGSSATTFAGRGTTAQRTTASQASLSST